MLIHIYMIIRTKIITIIALTIIITVGLATSIVLNVQNKKMVNAKLEDTVFLAEIIERTIESDMKQGNTKHVQQIIEDIGRSREILDLRILSPDGTILKSANTAELGSKSQDYIKSSFNGSSQKPTIINTSKINFYKTIQNKTECYECHSSKETVNGIIQVKVDISRSILSMLSVKRFFVFSNILVVLLVSLILSTLFSHFVMKPLRNLLATIHDVESGNWNATVKIESNDELGIIGSSFNKMIAELNNLYKNDINKEREISRIKLELEHKGKVEDLNTQLGLKIKELETANRAITSLSREVKSKNIDLVKAIDQLKKINDTSRILSSIIEPEELLKIITRTTADLLDTEKATLHVSDKKSAPSTLRYSKGTGVENLDNFALDHNARLREILTYGKPLFLPQSGEGDYLEPQIGVPLLIKGQIIGGLIVEHKGDGLYFTEDDLSLLTAFSNHVVVAIENAWLYKNIKNNYFSTIQSLVNALEASDKFTKGHSERVRFLSLELGKHIGLDFKELEILEHASILHDIGKIGIESFILQKQGKLTPNEYNVIKAHPLIGEEILGPMKALAEVRQTMIQHHEHYDGKGYPYGLRGDELSLKARILTVIDSFDAMMSDRPYRSALPLQNVKRELINYSGTQFDPYVVESFLEMLTVRGENILSAAGYYASQLISQVK